MYCVFMFNMLSCKKTEVYHMALIKCPNCDKEVSDKAKVCPTCGTHLIENLSQEEKSINVCEECGSEIPVNADSCLNCGCPVTANQTEEPSPQKVEIAAVNLQSVKKSTKKRIIFAVISVVMIAIIAIIVSVFNKQNKQKQYQETLQSATYSMLLGSVEAEEAGNLIKSVWYNSIHKESSSKTDKYTTDNFGWFYDDFNDALAKLFADSEFQEKITYIENNQQEVSSLMKSLTNPPDEMQEAYTALKEYYDAYIELTNLATNPSGSLQSFSNNFNTADTEAANCYNAMDLYIE